MMIGTIRLLAWLIAACILLQSCRDERVVQQHGDGQQADAAGHGRDLAGHFLDAPRNRRRPPGPLSIRFMPTSITTAPGLTMSAVTNRARPIATIRMSARAGDGGEIAGAAVANGHGGVAAGALLHQEHAPSACRRCRCGPPRRRWPRRSECRCAAAVAGRRGACKAGIAAGPARSGRRFRDGRRRRPCSGLMAVEHPASRRSASAAAIAPGCRGPPGRGSAGRSGPEARRWSCRWAERWSWLAMPAFSHAFCLLRT